MLFSISTQIIPLSSEGCNCSFVDRFHSFLQNQEEKWQILPIISAILTLLSWHWRQQAAQNLQWRRKKGMKKQKKKKKIVYQCLWNDIAQWSEQPLRANLFSSSLSRGVRVQYACPRRLSHSTDLIYKLYLCLLLPGTQKEKKIMEKCFSFLIKVLISLLNWGHCHRLHRDDVWICAISCCCSFNTTALAWELTFHGCWST